MIIRECSICQKPIKVAPSQLETKKFCSISCYRKWQSWRMSGERNPAYKGGTVVYTNGSNYGYRQRYIRGKRYKQPEHRFIMEQMLRRKFKPSEAVHHINGDTLDNRPENLIVMTRKEHSSFHLKKSPMNIHNLLNRIVTLEKENELLKQQFVTS